MIHYGVLTAFLLLAVPQASAARAGRLLHQAGRPQVHHNDPSGPIPTTTVPGGDVFVIDTTSQKVNAGGGVLSNQIQENARSGSTYDLMATVTRTQAISRANQDLRSAIGTQDHAAFVQEAANGDRTRDSIIQGTGSATITARGGGKVVDAPENRAALASLDASSAVQVAAGGISRDAQHATRTGSASASSVQVPESYWYVFVPTWW